MALDMTVAAPSGVTFKDELVAMLAHHSANQPRSQQRRLGPSEVGHPCTRKLAYGLTLAPRCNDHAGDPLPSMVGTGAHAQMEDVLAGYNEWHGQRFLIENRVEPTPGFTGTMDAYDLRDHAVIDWKFPGTTKMSTVRRDQHPGILYEVQAHLYGLGALRAGLTPRIVRIAFIPRAGFSTNTYVWEVPWNPEIAMAAINRMTSTIAMAADLQVDRHPDRYAVFPATPFQCDYCPWHHLKPAGPYECAGGDEGLRRRPLTPEPSVTEVSAADLLAPTNPAQRTV
ncbi:hypothetical protein [uncultured Gordonia sp.]|jgi:hypothetical protein|uniref:hypothetical protein n=1 Tax=Gordonia sp. (in: high G+C Gram-positive bacteria) TaxID=84139 RepID=UPI0026170C86|nr:hypothetical protein [uncultured Gordonia sp.]